MSETTNACGCGCSTMTALTNAAEPCGCGCQCCATTAKPKETEIAELEQLRSSIDARLAELQAS